MSLLLLFAGKTLHERLERQKQLAINHVAELDKAVLLNTDPQQLVIAILDEFTPTPLDIDFDKAMQLESQEVVIDVTNNPAFFQGGRWPKKINGMRYQVVVPFTGDSDLFTLRPSRTQGPGSAQGFLRGDDLVLVVDTWQQDAEQVKRALNEQACFLRTHADFVNQELSGFMNQTRGLLLDAVQKRRARLEEATAVQEALGIPLHKHPEALDPAPIQRKPLGLKALEEKAGEGPGYVMEDAAYEQVVEVLLHFGKALERTPRTFRKLKEPELRDFLLVILNSTFDGAATGEAFNGDGKTDVLVRIEDRNVFIGECKIWHDEGTWSGAIGQLLSYLVWRDTKAALILFIKHRKDIGAVITKAEKAIRDHDCYESEGPPSDDSELRRNFVLHSSADTERLIQLAFLPFVIPDAPEEDDQAPDDEVTA